MVFPPVFYYTFQVHQDQRQPFIEESRNSVASAVDPMKLTRTKGNHLSKKAGIQLPLP
jgi:hypothetical protein